MQTTTMIWFIIITVLAFLFLIAVLAVLVYGMFSNTTSWKAGGRMENHPKKDYIPLRVKVYSTEDTLPNEIKPSEPLMTEDGFAELKKCVILLRSLMSELSGEQRLYDMLNEKSVEAGGASLPDHACFCQVLKTVFVKDLQYSYEKIGRLFKISTYTAEGQCLLLITDLLNEKSSVLSEYTTFKESLNPIDEKVILSVIKYLSELTTKRITMSVEGDEEFAFSAMLINFDADSEYLTRYRSTLRRLFSCISEICGETQVRERDLINQMK